MTKFRILIIAFSIFGISFSSVRIFFGDDKSKRLVAKDTSELGTHHELSIQQS
jgi:hypothetical protein